MDRYAALFDRLGEKNQGAFVPFLTIGDPNPELSEKAIFALVEGGADALELGMPFSDPLADGPTIQGANLRALNANTTVQKCFDIITSVRSAYPDLPIGLLMYANLVFANGVESFYKRCKDAGVDSVLVADVPTNESKDFVAAAEKFGIHPIFIAPPTAPEETLKAVAQLGSGYTYLLSRAGVTGAETKANMPVHELLDKLASFDAPPCLLGFGISEPSQVKAALESGAAGAISGSAVVKIVETYQDDPDKMLAELKAFTQGMKAATQK
ncbi:tryptophan synthase subunit alpha [Vibrio viridaestus]|uniref:Tryptophan synthase alpha chain n=1 Tax=Vibrio viridaestus TaxID=2487322 RepID=A0A3N9TGH7_9VIBR|nr:tryptophan synthase subunit alpha [Vibrio viridaestus]RQW63377.1 tryptophan synthase subunit alpha [Vibrio viridaestus]